MNIRKLNKDEFEKVFYVWSQAFERGGRDDRSGWQSSWEDHWEEQASTYGLFDAAGLQAVLLINDYRMHFGPDIVLKMGGIGGVACLPASRGKGYAGAGLRYVLERMREMEYPVSTLYPFSVAYYRRFGWDWVGSRRRCEMSTSIMQTDPETEFVHAITPEERSKIFAVYTEHAKRYRGAFQRSERAWNNLLDDKKDKFTYTYLYERDGSSEGYLTFSGGKHEETRLREFLTMTPRAQRALIGLLKRHEMQCDKFSWYAPEDDTLWLTHPMHNDIETKIRPILMGRVVDIVGAFQAWKPKAEYHGKTILAVQDEAAPWNTGTWKVEFEGGNVTVQATTDAPHLSLDIQTLSQAYFGTPTVIQLRAADRLRIHDEAGYTAFRDLLEGPPMWLNDSF